jgi:hypothetical protein
MVIKDKKENIKDQKEKSRKKRYVKDRKESSMTIIFGDIQIL